MKILITGGAESIGINLAGASNNDVNIENGRVLDDLSNGYINNTNLSAVV